MLLHVTTRDYYCITRLQKLLQVPVITAEYNLVAAADVTYNLLVAVSRKMFYRHIHLEHGRLFLSDTSTHHHHHDGVMCHSLMVFYQRSILPAVLHVMMLKH